MAGETLESRVAILEAEFSLLKNRLEENKKNGWKQWVGAFLDDPYFEQAVKLGRKYRESTRPKARKAKAAK